MEYVIVDVLGNFGEYKGLLIPTTGRQQDTKEITEQIVRQKFGDTVLVGRIVADVKYRQKKGE